MGSFPVLSFLLNGVINWQPSNSLIRSAAILSDMNRVDDGASVVHCTVGDCLQTIRCQNRLLESLPLLLCYRLKINDLKALRTNIHLKTMNYCLRLACGRLKMSARGTVAQNCSVVLICSFQLVER